MASENENESIESIVALMRHDAELCHDIWLNDPNSNSQSDSICEILNGYARRIEAAWKREKAEIESDALAVGGVVEAARHKPGNAVAMRAALELALDALISWLNGTIDRTTNRETIKAIRAALAKPPRNCDAGTPDEQSERFTKYCKMFPRCRGCECCGKVLLGRCELAWAQMPYAAEEGAGK